MLLFSTVRSLKKHLKTLQKGSKRIGFVPTMGALHEGHLSLLRAAKRRGLITVCSIFVNPTQFNDPNDFEKYPITTEQDLAKLRAIGCDLVFLPSVKEIYPSGTAHKKPIDFGFLATTLEGEHRPGHFDGMAQVVERLLRIIEPDYLFMGLKDYQQQLIVAQLISHRNMGVKLVSLPTLREKDGLAMSSRNVRLGKEARRKAVTLYKELKRIEVQISKLKFQSSNFKAQVLEDRNAKSEIRNPKSGINPVDTIGKYTSASKARLTKKGFEVEYLEVRNAKTLSFPESIREKMVVLLAAKIDGVRLIDNVAVG